MESRYNRLTGGTKRIGGSDRTTSTPSGTAWWLFVALILLAVTGIAIAAFVIALVVNGSAVKTISGVPPNDDGEVTGVAGAGISITPDGVNNQLTIANTGVLSTIAGSGISVSSATGDVTIGNTGVLSALAGAGLNVDMATGDVTYDHVLTTQTLLAESDPNGPQVGYTHAFGFLVPIVENTWRMGFIPGFFPVLLPGSNPGDDGQGNGVVTWTVPSPGQYAIMAYCLVNPDFIRADDQQSFTMALSLGATTVNPFSGYVPQGGSTSLDISSGTTDIPAFPLRMNVAATIHAGCTGCIVQTGDALTIHIRQDHNGGGGAVTFSTFCRMKVSRQF